MSLRQRLIRALTSKSAGNALADSIAATAALAPLTSSSLRVDTLANLGADAEARLDALEARCNAITAADAAAGAAL